MRIIYIISFVILLTFELLSQSVGIGTTSPDVSAILDVSSTTQGFLLPRMTSAQRNAIASPKEGLQIFNTDDGCIDIRIDTSWLKNCGNKVIGKDTLNLWEAMATFPGMKRTGAVSFTIGSNLYISCGYTNQITLPLNDLWQYNSLTNIWTQKQSMPGVGRSFPFGISKGTKAVVGTGIVSPFSGTIIETNTVFEYDETANSWLQKANYPNDISGAFYFSIDNQSFVGGGYSANDLLNLNDDVYFNAFYQYDYSGDSWLPKDNSAVVNPSLSINGRRNSVGFGLNNKGYVALGYTGNQNGFYIHDLIEYSPINDSWLQKAPLPISSERAFAAATPTTAFVGGLCNPLENLLIQYNPVMDQWSYFDKPQDDKFIGPSATVGEKLFVLNDNNFYKLTHDTIFNIVSPPYVISNPFKKELWAPSWGNNIINENAGNVIFKKGIFLDSDLLSNSTEGINFGYGDAIIARTNVNFPNYSNLTFFTGGLPRITVTPSGNIGIGTNNPNGLLQFSNFAANRKIVLNEVTSDEFQFDGFGTFTNELRYIVAASTSDHKFFANNNNVFTIKGSGKVGINGAIPNGLLQFPNLANNRKIVLNEVANNNTEYDGFGTNANELRYNVAATSSSHNFYTNSFKRFSINGFASIFDPDDHDGTVGIGRIADGGGWDVGLGIGGKNGNTWGIGSVGGNLFIGLGDGLVTNSMQTAMEFNKNRNVFLVPISGNVGIGTSIANGKLQFANTLDNRKIVLWEVANNNKEFYGIGIESGAIRYNTAGDHRFYRGTGPSTDCLLFNIHANGNATLMGNLTALNLTCSSDATLKKNILPISSSAISILTLQGYNYQWKNAQQNQSLQSGFLAQDIEKLFPHLVSKDANGLLSVNYIGLLPYMVEAMKELKKENEILKLEILKTEHKNEEFDKRLKLLEDKIR